MKKTIFITILALNALTIKAQESTPKLKLHAANLGFGGFYLGFADDEEIGGLAFLADATLSLNKHLISASYLTGSEIGILDGALFQFSELSLLYGREWKAANWFYLEGYAGLGYYIQEIDGGTVNDYPLDDKTTISFPLRLNSKFYFTKAFGMGFNTNYSINSAKNNFSTNLIFHYRFN